MTKFRWHLVVLTILASLFLAGMILSLHALESAQAQATKKGAKKSPAPAEEGEFTRFGIYEKTAPRPGPAQPVATTWPLALKEGDRIALIGNTLMERAQDHGDFEALLHQQFPRHRLVIRNMAWSADTIDLQPRPANFADLEQHLFHEKIDVIVAAYGFNESFAGAAGLAAFKTKLAAFVAGLKAKAFNGKTGPRLVLVSPSANENVQGVAAADLNNARIKLYVEAMAARAKP
jgi:hypothetical protein